MLGFSTEERARKRIWVWWALLSVLLVCMPSLVMIVIAIAWGLTGNSLGYRIETAPDVYLTSIILLPMFLVLANWPLFTLLPLGIRWMLRNAPDHLRRLRWALAGAISALVIINAPLWLIAPADVSSKGGGEGTALIGSTFVVLSPITGVLGWFVGMAIAILIDKLRGVKVRRED